MRTFVIGDTHFGHKNILKFQPEERPFATIEEHDEALITSWNSAVKDSDRVIHLGDVALGYKTDPSKIIPRLNGKKILVAGNHDVYWTTQEWLDFGFSEVVGSYSYANYILTHIPVHSSQQERWKGNIHGHLHNNKIDDPWYFCASVERTNFAPLNIDDVIHFMEFSNA